MIIFLPFWWKTSEQSHAKDYRKMLSETLDKETWPAIQIKEISFNLQSTSSSSLFLGSLILVHLAQ